MLCKSSENCVFTPNDGLVEKKCVVWAIVCCDLSVINRWLAMEEYVYMFVKTLCKMLMRVDNYRCQTYNCILLRNLCTIYI